MYLSLRLAARIAVALSVLLSQNLQITLRITTAKVVTVAITQMAQTASIYYERSVGWQAVLSPGENRKQSVYRFNPQTGQPLRQYQHMNVVGLNEPLSGHFFQDLFRQGGGLSRGLNQIPGANSAAALHDYWFHKPDGLSFTPLNNLLTILPAFLISTAALLGNWLRESGLGVLAGPSVLEL